MFPLAEQRVTKQGEQYRNHANQLDRERCGLHENGLTPRAHGSTLTWIWSTEQALVALPWTSPDPLSGLAFSRRSNLRDSERPVLRASSKQSYQQLPHAKFKRRCGG